MGRFTTGLGAEHPQAKRGGKSGFTPTLTWKDGEVKFVQFLTPAEDIPSVLMHQFIIVGKREDGKDDFMEFVSRKDVAFDGDEGYDPIWDRFGIEPKVRRIGLAIEMTEVIEKVGKSKKRVGFEPSMRTFDRKDGSSATVLDVKLINQSPFVFWDDLNDLHEDRPINEYVWKIKRTGGSRDTRYSFIDVASAVEVEVPDEEKIDLEAYLENLAGLDRLKVIDDLPDSARISKYPPKGAVGKGSNGSRAASPSSDEDDSGDVDESRDARYAEFRNKIKRD